MDTTTSTPIQATTLEEAVTRGVTAVTDDRRRAASVIRELLGVIKDSPGTISHLERHLVCTGTTISGQEWMSFQLSTPTATIKCRLGRTGNAGPTQFGMTTETHTVRPPVGS